MNALIIETAFLGDAIISLSLARAIKAGAPGSRVTYLVRPDANEVISASPDVDAVISFDKRGMESGMRGIRNKADELNALGFDTLFVLHSSTRSQRLASLINCNVKIGFEGMTHAGLTRSIADRTWRNRYERAVLLLRSLASDISLDYLPRIVPPVVPEVEQFVAQFEQTIVLAPGSVWETKKWGDEKYLGLARELVTKSFGVIVIGGKSEAPISKRVREVCSEGYVLDFAGRASFLQSMYAIARSSLVLANDSAPVHAAVAVGTKSLVIFGPTVPDFGFAPPDGSGEVIELPGLWCRPCTPHGSHVCPVYTHACMKGISVDAVLERVLSLVQAQDLDKPKLWPFV